MTNIAEIYQTMSYGPAPEQADYVQQWLNKRSDGFGFFINGEWIRPISPGQTLETHNPATGERLATLCIAEQNDINAAVAAAKEAYIGWSGASGHERARYLYALASALLLKPENIGERATFADIGQSLASHLGLAPLDFGISFL